MDINGKTVVLTGATGGIGRVIARQLSDKGADLVLVARNPDRLFGLAGQFGDRNHRAVAADLSTPEGRSSVAEACRDGVSLLINCAGISDFGLFGQSAPDTIGSLIEVNLMSPILLCLELLPFLERESEARIINIGSTFGSIGYPGFSTYCATKFGLRGFTEALRRELADSSVAVSYIAPRATRTDLNTDSIVAMNNALGTAMDEPAVVAAAVMRDIQGASSANRYVGWPEKLFVRINALFPGLVDNSLRKQLPTIRRFAAGKT
jgi:short-subunit dehydrogenase